ncbi:MAG: thiamine pyrophosphate-binding protein [Candidatus Rokubacteria bacterium]|nr:thiamine pyrophosphate-binding protein [Candidatus Rokubacteria bacterium]
MSQLRRSSSAGSQPLTGRTGGEWVVAALAAHGVRHVFGIPGVHNLAVYDALLGQSAMAHILARHEQGAGFMADGYARASGQVGVVLVTTGPGATNALTPLVESGASSQPVLLLMSDIPAALIGRDVGALHEVPDQIECFRPVSRHAETIRDGRLIPAAIARAFAIMTTGRPGPVSLSIPTDLLTARVESALAARLTRPPACDRSLIDRAAAVLEAARRPLIVAGGGVVSAGATAELQAVARRLGAPVVTTVMGRGSLPETDPLWLGVLPNKLATQPALEAADVVLAVGCRFAHRSTQGLLLNLSFRPEQTLIHLDIDPAVFGKLYPPAIAIVGDARDGLAGLGDALAAAAPAREWDAAWLAERRTARSKRFTPAIDRLIRILREALPDDAIVVNDQTGINYWMEWHFPVLEPRTFLYPIGSATLGYGVPAAIGAKVARPERAVLCVVGDGGFLFSVNELATAVKYRLPVVFLLMNDERYGAIEYLQDAMFGRHGEADLANPDFQALARAFGVESERVERLEELPRALEKALAHSAGPTLVELPLGIGPPWEL